jgi:hypothetical protein
MSNPTEYTEVPASTVPQSIVWVTPERNQGRFVEVSYSRGIPADVDANMDAGEGDPWKRVTDRSDMTVTCYRRVSQ